MAHNKLQYDPPHDQKTSLESIVFSETSAAILSSCCGAGSLKPLIYGEVVDALDTKFVGSRKQLENDKTLSDHNIQSVTISFRTCITLRQHSRSGEAQSHQEDRAEQMNPSPKRR